MRHRGHTLRARGPPAHTAPLQPAAHRAPSASDWAADHPAGRGAGLGGGQGAHQGAGLGEVRVQTEVRSGYRQRCRSGRRPRCRSGCRRVSRRKCSVACAGRDSPWECHQAVLTCRQQHWSECSGTGRQLGMGQAPGLSPKGRAAPLSQGGWDRSPHSHAALGAAPGPLRARWCWWCNLCTGRGVPQRVAGGPTSAVLQSRGWGSRSWQMSGAGTSPRNSLGTPFPALVLPGSRI